MLFSKNLCLNLYDFTFVSITAFKYYKIYFLKFGVIDQLTVQYKLTQTAEMIKQSVNMIILSRFFCLSNPK